MRNALLFAGLALVLTCGTAAAQDRTDAVPDGEGTAETTRPDREGRAGELLRRVLGASRLPRSAEDARDAGVPEERVRDVIRIAREREMRAGETGEILVVETEGVRRGGNPDNFGAAVQQMKASGLRGRELAAAIHAEQIARGMKKPKSGLSKGKGKQGGPAGDGPRRDGKGKGKGKGSSKSRRNG